MAALVGCATMSTSTGSIDTITHAPFGKTPDGTPVEIYTLHNSKGAEARIMTYGGIVQKLTMPDKNGKFADIVLGFDNLDGYTKDSYVKACPYFGALIGRYGNRIGGAKFTLEGKTYTLAANNGPNSLHGGLKGFDKVVWTPVKADVGPEGPRLVLNYLSKDGEEGFPGNLNVTATYTLTDDNALKLTFTATTDKPTVVNLTHHSYFNLAGQGNGDILGELVYINADQTTPVDSGLIPTGAFADVTGTPFDFRKPTAIGARINDPNHHPPIRPRLRPQLGHQQAARQVRPDGARDGPDQRPRDGSLERRARPAILRRQFPRRHAHRQGRQGLSAPLRLLHGAAALSRLAEQAEFPLDGTQARPDLPQHHRV